MWEVFTCGKMPYGRLENAEVVGRVQRGIILERPPRCPKKIYSVITIPFLFPYLMLPKTWQRTAKVYLKSSDQLMYFLYFNYLGYANVLGSQRR